MTKALLSKTLHTLPTLCLLAVATLSTAQQTPITEVAGVNLDSMRVSGLRIDWVNAPNGKGLYLPTITNDSMYILDGSDFLTRYDLDSGKWIWSTPIGNQVFEMLSISEIPQAEEVYVLSNGALYMNNSVTGRLSSLTSDQPSSRTSANDTKKVKRVPTSYASGKPYLTLEWTPNTPAIVNGHFIVYGSTKGDLIWFNPLTGFTAFRYNLGHAINTTPVVAKGKRNKKGREREIIIGSSADGTITAIDSGQIQQLWSMRLTAQPAAPLISGTNSALIENEELPRDSVFIAGEDQYVRAVDLHTGKPRWKILTSSQLEDSPFLLGNKLYQRIPNSGLTCFEAFPNDLSGNIFWTSEEVQGNVISTNKKNQLLCWDPRNKLLQTVDTNKGGVVATLPLPSAKQVLADSTTNGSLFIVTTNDEILRLTPR
jgi:outer membrane protein assembly factor BamB